MYLPPNLVCVDLQFVKRDFVKLIMLSNHQPSQRIIAALSYDIMHTMPLSQQSISEIFKFIE